MPRPSAYPRELRERAIQMVAEVRPNYSSERAAITAVAHQLGIATAECLRRWVPIARVDADQLPGQPVRSPQRSSGCGRRTPSCVGPTKS